MSNRTSNTRLESGQTTAALVPRPLLPGWLRNAWGVAGALAAGYVLLFLAWTHFHWGGEANVSLIADVAFLPLSLFASACAWRVAADRRFDPRLRRAWLILGLGIFSQFVADLIWFYLEVILKVAPYPSLADLFYLSLYPLALWGLLSLPGAPLSRGDRVKFSLDLAIVMTAAWMVVWYFIIHPAAAASQSDLLSQALAAAYPIGDLAVLGGIVVLLFRRPDPVTRSALLFFLTGLAVFLSADLIYAYTGLVGAYASGGWVDAGWVVAYLLFAFAALRQSSVASEPSPPYWSARVLERLSLVLPFAAIGLGYGLVIFAAIGGEQTGANVVGLFVGAALLAVFMMGRQLAALNENKRLNAELHAASDELRTMSKGLEERVAARTRDLALAAEIGRRISAMRDLNALLSEAVELIQARFDLYYTQIYLADASGRMLGLQAGTGPVGAELLRRGHRLPIGPGSTAGMAAAERRTVIVADAMANDLSRPDPWLPETRSEIAMPLIAGEQVIGVLDLHSARSGAFDADKLLAFEALVGQLVVAIDNTELFAQAERSRIAAEEAIRSLTRRSWGAYLDVLTGSNTGYIYDDHDHVTPLSSGDDPSTSSARRMPLLVRGETIGEIAVAVEASLSQEAPALMAAVAGQLSAHIENLRLAEQAQAALAAQERLSAELRASEAELRSLFAAMNDVVLVYDAQGRYLEIAPTNPSLLYRPPADMLGKTLGEVLPAAQAEAFLGYIQHVLNTLQTLNVEYALPIGGKDILFSATLSPLTEETVFWIARDVTERKQAETALAKRATELQTVAQVSTATSTVLEAQALLQNVVDLTKESFDLYHAHVYLLDADGQTLTLAAGAGEVGRQMTAAGRSLPLNQEQSLVARAARTRQAVIVNDVRAAPDFLPHPLLPETRSEMAVPMIVGDRVLGVFDVQHDQLNYFTDEDVRIQTTLAAQVAVALQNANLFAEQAATVVRLRELDQLKSTFLANMSHELRTPLNSILGFADVMLEGLDGPLTGQMDNDLKVIQKNGRHLLELINDVLDMAKIEAGKMNLSLERFDLNEVLEEVLELTGPLARERALELRIEPGSADQLMVEADRVRLRQVMINLVGNAIKFTETGSISLRAAQSDGHIRLAVRDTGLGIPPDKLDTIFEAFSQVDTSTTRRAGGTGLGLPISRRLIELHGGRLWAESAGVPGLEGGSTFFIELPAEAQTEAVR